MPICVPVRWNQVIISRFRYTLHVPCGVAPHPRSLRVAGGQDNACLYCFLPIFFIISFHFAHRPHVRARDCVPPLFYNSLPFLSVAPFSEDGWRVATQTSGAKAAWKKIQKTNLLLHYPNSFYFLFQQLFNKYY